jgi:hypothetical protein
MASLAFGEKLKKIINKNVHKDLNNTPYVEIGQIATAFYFSFYLIIVPVIGLVENTLMDLATDNN